MTVWEMNWRGKIIRVQLQVIINNDYIIFVEGIKENDRYVR